MHLLAVHRYRGAHHLQSVRDLQHDLLGREIGSVEINCEMSEANFTNIFTFALDTT
jgi:hypothetical protein